MRCDGHARLVVCRRPKAFQRNGNTSHRLHPRCSASLTLNSMSCDREQKQHSNYNWFWFHTSSFPVVSYILIGFDCKRAPEIERF
jgi:hypothetical protein